MRKITTRKTGLVRRTHLLVTMAGMLLSGIAQANNCSEMPTNDTVYNIVNEATGRYMDVANNSMERNADIHQWQKNGYPNQQFKVLNLGNGYWSIHPVSSKEHNMALDVAGGSTSDGARIIQWEYGGQHNQQWKFNQAENGAIKIVSRRSGKLITVAQDANGAKLYQRSILANHMAPHQNWYFNPVESNCGSDKGAIAGWAEGTTGGGNATPERVESCDALETALSSKGPKVIQVPDRTLDCRTTPKTVQVCTFTCGNKNGETNPHKEILWNPGSNRCATLFEDHSKNNPTARMLNKQNTTLNNRTMRVESDKTLVGLGPNSKLVGATLYLDKKENIIIRNLAIENVNPHLIEAYDAISMMGSKNVWIDHIKTSMISDGHWDIYDSENVTLSWNRFEGLNPHYCGGRDPYLGFALNTTITFHHNYWRYSNGRNPKVSNGSRAHIYNNLWKEITGHAVSVSGGAQAKLEGNFFENVHNPHWLVNKDEITLIDSGESTNVHIKRELDPETGKNKVTVVPKDNRISARHDSTLDYNQPPISWRVPYQYEVQSAKDAMKDIVKKGTGPQ